MQFQADILDLPVVTSEVPEVSALGAASLAWQGLGVAMPGVANAAEFQPDMQHDLREQHLERWRLAVGQTLHEAEKH
jgi:glycerol kinase